MDEKRLGALGTISLEGEEFDDMAGMEAEHGDGSGKVPGVGAKKDKTGQCNGGSNGQGGMGEKHRGDACCRVVAETGKKVQAFANAEEGQGVEGMVGFKTHGKVARSVFQKPEYNGGSKTG